MKDVTEWKFARHDGLPKGDGARAFRYFGFDADGAAYIMRWTDLEGGHWVAIGFDQRGEPIFYILRDENADLIKSHALCPLRWSELGLPPKGEISQHDARDA